MAAQTYEISPRVLKKYFMIERSERVKNYLFICLLSFLPYTQNIHVKLKKKR